MKHIDIPHGPSSSVGIGSESPAASILDGELIGLAGLDGHAGLSKNDIKVMPKERFVLIARRCAEVVSDVLPVELMTQQPEPHEVLVRRAAVTIAGLYADATRAPRHPVGGLRKDI